jgi:hypothetical protein
MKSEDESIVTAYAKYLDACDLKISLWLVYIRESKRYAIVLTVSVMDMDEIE